MSAVNPEMTETACFIYACRHLSISRSFFKILSPGNLIRCDLMRIESGLENCWAELDQRHRMIFHDDVKIDYAKNLVFREMREFRVIIFRTSFYYVVSAVERERREREK